VRPAHLVLVAAAAFSAVQSRASEPIDSRQADMRRALAAVGPSTSEEPALRGERQARDPSPAFLLGAALGAWINAAAQLDFDRDNPTAAGPPHVSQSGADPDALAQDCAEEKLAFFHLEARRGTLGLSAEQAAAIVPLDAKSLASWRSRISAPPPICG